MKVGDYVRTKYGYIAKLIEIRPYLEDGETIETEIYDFDKNIDGYNNGVDCEYAKEIIIKSSPNIIDLIKKKDIVIDYKGNIYQVVKVWKGYVFTDMKNEYGQVITLVDYQIKSIVTKEQYESMKYKVGE